MSDNVTGTEELPRLPECLVSTCVPCSRLRHGDKRDKLCFFVGVEVMVGEDR